jgi:hypothetical protein
MLETQCSVSRDNRSALSNPNYISTSIRFGYSRALAHVYVQNRKNETNQCVNIRIFVLELIHESEG